MTTPVVDYVTRGVHEGPIIPVHMTNGDDAGSALLTEIRNLLQPPNPQVLYVGTALVDDTAKGIATLYPPASSLLTTADMIVIIPSTDDLHWTPGLQDPSATIWGIIKKNDDREIVGNSIIQNMKLVRAGVANVQTTIFIFGL